MFSSKWWVFVEKKALTNNVACNLNKSWFVSNSVTFVEKKGGRNSITITMIVSVLNASNAIISNGDN